MGGVLRVLAVALALAAPPPPDAPLPTGPRTLAAAIAENEEGLRAAVRTWDLEDPPTEAVTLHALFQQRAARLLARRPDLVGRVLDALPPSLRYSTRQTSTAFRELGRLTPPTTKKRFRTGEARPAAELMRHYRAAQRRFGVGWHVLAAVNMVETQFNRLRNDSTAGAQGPMQFIPSTWRAYGMGGDIHDVRDAIMGAANYLRASGAPRDYRRALFAYNRSSLYVRAVRRFARVMARGRYPQLYAWQVFVRTPQGDRRLTGP
jgi:membrane-bound lytic murein transglycosylase B